MRKPNKIEMLKESLNRGELETIIKILLKHGYQIKVWGDELTVVVEYDYSDADMCSCALDWYDMDKQFICDIEEES